MDFYFTFGQAHVQLDGTPMKDYWVRVTAADYGSAREKFCKDFSSQFMDRVDRWAFQYEEGSFDHSFYPAGEYLHIV